MAKQRALSGLRVIELAELVSGPYCGKLLADLGAEVIKVEPPEGDASRRVAPAWGKAVGSEPSSLYAYNNTSKRSVVLDLDGAKGRDQLGTLIASADALIDNHPPGWLRDRGFSWDALQAVNPVLVYTTVTAYGHTGPRRAATGDELTMIQAGGLGNLLPARSTGIDLPPVKLGGYQVAYNGALVAALVTLTALYGRAAFAGPRRIDVSLQEVVLALVAPNVASTRYQRSTWSRVPDRPPAMGRLQTKDGYVILNAMDDHHFKLFRGLMGDPEWCSGDEWLSMAYRAQHLMDQADKIEEWVLAQEKHALHREAGALGIPIGPICDAADVLAGEQYAARDYFVEIEHAEAGQQSYPGWPYKMSASPPKASPAPRLGEHTDQIRAGLAGLRPAASAPDAQGPAGRTDASPAGAFARFPLTGVRVLELAWVWAGPYAGMLLGSLGADVIKVEGHHRTDLTRRSVVWPLEDPAPTQVPPNQGMAFNAVNMNKRAVTLNLALPEGVELAQKLAARCDVVYDNMRPGALIKLGLGYDALSALREDIIVASSSGRGHVGPDREFLGYAMIHQAIGGGAHITGHPEDHPCHSGGDIDLMNAVTFAFAIVAALHHRAATGEGQFIDYSQCEGVTSLLGEVLLDFQRNGALPERCGNRHPRWAPHNVYPAWGVDRWLAIEVHSDQEFGRLSEAVGHPSLAADPRFASEADRKANESQLDEILAGWTCSRDRDWMADHLQRHGVKAAPSREARDLYADPHLRERGAFVEVEHPELGPLELVGAPWKMSDWTMPNQPAPKLGQDNEDVLGQLLGLSAEEIEGLRERDVIA